MKHLAEQVANAIKPVIRPSSSDTLEYSGADFEHNEEHMVPWTEVLETTVVPSEELETIDIPARPLLIVMCPEIAGRGILLFR